MILCSNPKAQYLAHKAEIDAAIASVLEKGWYILGEEVQAFEEEFSNYIGVHHAIGVGNGTEALHLALKACGIGSGDEVITVSHTAVATAAAIELAGATPVFVDIEPVYFNIDPVLIERAITSKTKAIIPVHIYGQAADMDAINQIAQRKNIKIIEDCAQATGGMYKGSRLGSIGDIACFSFYPTKNLGAIGDGGMVVTNNKEIALKVKKLREYGWDESRNSQIAGANSRLDELQAAILRVKIRYLEEDNLKRRNIVELYKKDLKGVLLPESRPNTIHAFHLYVIRCAKRDEFFSYLKDHGCSAGIHYRTPIHMQRSFQKSNLQFRLPKTEKIANEIISLPIYPELSTDQTKEVIRLVNNFYNK